MIKIGKLTDYAIVTIAQMAKEGAETSACSASLLAERTGLAEPTVAKVLKLLAAGGLVASTRGASGGYRLLKPFHEISIAEVIEILDGPIAIVSCVEGAEAGCRITDKCGMNGKWNKTNRKLRAVLQETMVWELAMPEKQVEFKS